MTGTAPAPEPVTGPTDSAARGETLVLVAVAALCGAATGLVATTFAVLLEHAATLRGDLVGWAHAHRVPGFLALALVVACTTALAAWLVHRVEPHAEGSGIPRVEAVVEGRAAPGRLRILPVKYVGGLLAIGGGLALGREGPSVQMGGVIAATAARAARLDPDDLRMIVAGGAAAGLATAVHAPIAGGVFVLEELFKRFDHRATLATLAASGSGFAVAHVLGQEGTVFVMPQLPSASLAQAPLIAAVGLVCGVVAVAYNRVVMAALALADRSRVPVTVRAALIGLGVGVLAWFAPSWVGSGDDLTQDALLGRGVLATGLVLVAVRFVLGTVSYAANTPGGLFAPMLTLGSQTGLLVALAAGSVVHLPAGTSSGMALAGMAAFFTASVQAPVTGLVLATEMTGSVTWLPALLGAVAVAMATAAVLRSESIYDLLTTRSARHAQRNVAEAGRRA